MLSPFLFPTLSLQCVKDADIVVTATLSTIPVLQGEWLKSGAHVNCVGACFPSQRELSDSVMHRSVLVVDSYEGARTESGDVIQTDTPICAEIGELLSGTRTLSQDKTRDS